MQNDCGLFNYEQIVNTKKKLLTNAETRVIIKSRKEKERNTKMYEIKGEKVFGSNTWTAETEQDAINMAWTMYVEKWYPKVTVTNKATGEVIYRKA